ncbi:MAG: type II toxin-antitoxin system VapC family toxin [Gemmatimonadota bacterium]|nr:type II toxin-antitoxin system VapC family toxin [Gemmatimonadota bacterium]
MIHLDTSFLIRAMDQGSPEDRKLRAWIVDGEALAMSTVAWTELLCGPLNPSEMEWAAEVIGQRRNFTSEHAVIAARLFNDSGRRRGSLIDCMIGATALAEGASIATANAVDFRRFATSGLELA